MTDTKAKDTSGGSKERFLHEAKGQLKEWQRKLQDMKREAGRTSEDARVELERKVEDLGRKRDELEHQIQAAGSSVSEGWEDAKKDLRSALDTFKDAASEALGKLRD